MSDLGWHRYDDFDLIKIIIFHPYYRANKSPIIELARAILPPPFPLLRSCLS